MNKTLAPNLSLREIIFKGVRQGFFSFYTIHTVMPPVYPVIAGLKEPEEAYAGFWGDRDGGVADKVQRI